MNRTIRVLVSALVALALLYGAGCRSLGTPTTKVVTTKQFGKRYISLLPWRSTDADLVPLLVAEDGTTFEVDDNTFQFVGVGDNFTAPDWRAGIWRW
jgi:hypothetical protein